MLMFDKSNVDDLKKYIYYSNIHDARLVNVFYNYTEHTLNINTYNPIFESRIDFLFENIKFMMLINNKENECVDTIISLTLEDGFDNINGVDILLDSNKYLCLLFQMLTGNEIYVMCERVNIK